MADLIGHRALRRRLFGGYNPEDVQVILTELRLENGHLAQNLEQRWHRLREVEGELAAARGELETRRLKESELAQAMTSAHRRAAEIEEAAESRARSLVTEAEEAATRIRADAAVRTEELRTQVDELMRLKDDLVRGMRGVIRDFDHVVNRIDRGEPLLATPATPPAPTATHAGEQQSLATGPAPQPAATDTRLPAGAAEQVFDARVELEAGPFSDFAALSAFERALSRLPKVEDVYIRRFGGDRALIELTLAEPAPLLRAMSEFLPYPFDVESAERTRVAITVRAPQPAAAG